MLQRNWQQGKNTHFSKLCQFLKKNIFTFYVIFFNDVYVYDRIAFNVKR